MTDNVTKMISQDVAISHFLRPGQRVNFQDPITKKWTLTGKITGFRETDRNYWVKDDKKARRYRWNRCFIIIYKLILILTLLL